MSPLKRFFNLLSLDRKDIIQVFFYALFAGLVSLSLPLGVQAIVNFIQSGRVSASWIVLIVVVLIGVGLVGILSLMQLRITENIQQKIFIRSSFEFAARLPKIRFGEIYTQYPPEVANRFFDTLTIQKGTSKLLIDFSAALLQIVFGIILLSLYHPFFIIFGIALLLLLYLIFRVSFSAGLETSMNESKFKYRVASWLQEIARNNFSFRRSEHYLHALQKNDMITSSYLSFRERHFRVIQRQFSQLIFFKIIITGTLLSLGGYLVVKQQMNIGQFVAAEIIILLVINSIEKIILGLEIFYDVLTSVEKIGEVTDMKIEDEKFNEPETCYSNITLQTERLFFSFPQSSAPVLRDVTLSISQGEKIVLEGRNGSGKTTLMRILCGLLKPNSGSFFINDDTFNLLDLRHYRSHIGVIINGETPFEGTIRENLTFNDSTIVGDDLRWALKAVKLDEYIKSLPDGLDTMISPEGKQLSSSNAKKILLARSIIHKPLVLFYEDPTDTMDEDSAREIIDFIFSQPRWTVIVTSKNPYWKTAATRVIKMGDGQIISDTNISGHA